jgi:nitric oxide reductase subunit B
MIFGFTVLAIVTVLAYNNAPPIPRAIVDPAGRPLFSGADIEGGQDVFLKHALMEHGTLWGHGAYLGPDYTAEYLHREVAICRDLLATERFGAPFESLPASEQATVATAVRTDLKTN